MKFLIGIVVVIAILAYILYRRGSGGLGSSGSSDTEAGALAQQTHQGPSNWGTGG